MKYNQEHPLRKKYILKDNPLYLGTYRKRENFGHHRRNNFRMRQMRKALKKRLRLTKKLNKSRMKKAKTTDKPPLDGEPIGKTELLQSEKSNQPDLRLENQMPNAVRPTNTYPKYDRNNNHIQFNIGNDQQGQPLGQRIKSTVFNSYNARQPSPSYTFHLPHSSQMAYTSDDCAQVISTVSSIASSL